MVTNQITKIKDKIIRDIMGNNSSDESKLKKTIKFKCLKAAYIQKLEHGQIFSGRCISYRYRKNLSSFVIRNKVYGVEIRLFVNNPRLLVYYPR